MQTGSNVYRDKWKSKTTDIDLDIIVPTRRELLYTDIACNNYMKPHYLSVMKYLRELIDNYEFCMIMECKAFTLIRMQGVFSDPQDDEYAEKVIASAMDLTYFKVLEFIKQLVPKYFTQEEYVSKFEKMLEGFLETIGTQSEDISIHLSELQILKSNSLFTDVSECIDSYKDKLIEYDNKEVVKAMIELNEYICERTKHISVETFKACGTNIVWV